MASNVTLLGISGPSSSGKTTLARLLRSILLQGGHHAFIIHEDDFYVTDQQIPIHEKTGLQDWDCIEAIDVGAFEQALRHIKDHGASPPHLQSKEDQNSVGKVDIDDRTITRLVNSSRATHLPQKSVVAIIDGFLLYTPALEAVYSLMDVRMFLPLTRDLMISRRSARSGYVTLEGFWEDPPGYVEEVVWPNYAKDHAFLFNDGDVEGELKKEQVDTMQLRVAHASAMQDINVCLDWAWQTLERHFTSQMR
ncbi:hypothetical protein AMS68_003596 [Peltaster fructicola]|uniref:Phosphoribulokinase/uridine kinase domain-containing protein n=1 Tax=Peltaster fructicola TaxID=286661 RepID=A0A6H0XTY6_9PEZI|nr:hypothetical protein AMS68_003596 [Peltaster fructicola]